MYLMILIAAAIVPVDGQVIATDTVIAPGTYALPNGLVITGDGVHVDLTGVTLQGAGANTGLTVSANNSSVVGGTVTGYETGLSVQDSANNSLVGTRFVGNARGGYTVGWSTRDNVFQSVSFSHNTNDGLLLDYSSQPQRFIGSAFDGNGDNGIFINYNAPTFEGCSFSGNGANGFFTVGYFSRGTLVKGSTMSNNAGCGAAGWTAPAVRYESNIASGNGRAGFCIEGGPDGIESDGELVGNTIDHNAGDGITGSTQNPHVLVEGSSIHHNGGSAIATAAVDWKIAGNEIDHNTGDGVQVAGEDETISRNRIHDNCGVGVNVLVATERLVLEMNDIYANGACRGGIQFASVQALDAGANGSGNWWGHPLTAGVDTNDPSVTDTHALASAVFPAADTIPPALSGVPGAIVAEANGPAGATVTWTPPVALDVVDGPTPVVCDGVPGATYELGTTLVTCTSTDASGNIASASFTIEVRDSTPPAVTVPADLSVYATSASGVTVTFASSAVDVVDGPLPVACSKASGALFAPGITTVICSGTDAHGNVGSSGFRVNVSFQFGGFLPPLREDGSSLFKRGGTVPVKFQLIGASMGIADARAELYVNKLSESVEGTEEAATSTSAATSGNLFRYDPGSAQYIFNLATNTLSAGTWVVLAKLGDGVVHEQKFALRE